MKTRIFPFISLLLASVCMLALGACSEEMSYENPNNAQEARLMLNTRGFESLEDGTESESEVKTLRAIVFEVTGTDANLTYIKQLKNEFYNYSSGISFPKCNQVRVILIANEWAEWNLGNTSLTIDEIKEFPVNYASSGKNDVNITTPVIMFGESETLSGKTDRQSTTITIERNIARVDLNLSCVAAGMSGLNGGTLKLKSARIQGMAPYAGLETSVKTLNLNPSDYLTSVAKEFKEGENVLYSYEDGKFTGFTTLKDLFFYVPEHYVTDKKKYTYITITTEYFLPGSATGIPMEYTLPVGHGLTTSKVNNNLLSADELTIERNSIYQMKATIASLQQLTDIAVAVKPWEPENVNGSINNGIYHLNVSDIFPTLAIGGETLVQFWSNLPSAQIRVLPTGTIKETGVTFNTNDIFVSLSDEDNSPRATNLEFVSDAQWGRLRLCFKGGASIVTDKTYIITLAAGGLQRTISVTAKEKQKANNETNN